MIRESCLLMGFLSLLSFASTPWPLEVQVFLHWRFARSENQSVGKGAKGWLLHPIHLGSLISPRHWMGSPACENHHMHAGLTTGRPGPLPWWSPEKEILYTLLAGLPIYECKDVPCEELFSTRCQFLLCTSSFPLPSTLFLVSVCVA